MKPVIAVDLDEVLGDFIPALVAWHNDRYQTKLVPSDFFSYTFKEVWGGTDAESVEKVHTFFTTDYFVNIKPVPQAKEVLERLKSHFEFVVVTSRQHVIAAETRRWLKEHYNNIFTEVYFGNHWSKDAPNPDLAAKNKTSKPDMCKRVNAIAIIDDSTKYAYQCAPFLKKVILFGNYAWNQNYINSSNSNSEEEEKTNNIIVVENEFNNVIRLTKWVDVEAELMKLLLPSNSNSNNNLYSSKKIPQINNGTLFQYTATPCPLQAFESGVVGANNVIIMLGGLTDGLLACSYVSMLSSVCFRHSFALIQPVLRSSYCQFGMQTLESDVEDLSALVGLLKETRGDDLKITIIGHSTGCQIAVMFCKHATLATKYVDKIVLQAPVSDREAMVLEESAEYVENLTSIAKKHIQDGKGNKIVHTLYGIAPLTAVRTVDLFSRGGKDDMFSSDLTVSELNGRLGHMKSFKTLISISLDDQYVPKGVYPTLSLKLKDAMSAHTLLEIPNADHSLRNDEKAKEIFIDEITKFIFC
jgi:hypothetical protein